MNLIDLVFPKECLECKKPGRYICEDCVAKVGRGGISKDHISIFRYEGVIRKAIIALKYKFATEVTNELVGYLVASLLSKRLLPKRACLVPIPMFWYRENFRGFNQSEEIGKLLAKKMGWDFIPDFLVKKKSTKSQVELRGLDRRWNLRGVFSLNSRLHIPDSDIVVFDDVYTTGSTLKEATEVLRVASTQKIWGLTIAR